MAHYYSEATSDLLITHWLVQVYWSIQESQMFPWVIHVGKISKEILLQIEARKVTVLEVIKKTARLVAQRHCSAPYPNFPNIVVKAECYAGICAEIRQCQKGKNHTLCTPLYMIIQKLTKRMKNNIYSPYEYMNNVFRICANLFTVVYDV